MIRKVANFDDTNDNAEDGQILLYYCYVRVEEPQALRHWQVKLCKALRLKGRIHVGLEGINGTVGGSTVSCRAYMTAMRSHNVWGEFFLTTKTRIGKKKRKYDIHICAYNITNYKKTL